MGMFRDSVFFNLSMKGQLVKLFQDGFADLFDVPEVEKPYGPNVKKINVFRRDPVLRSVGDTQNEMPCVAINRLGDGEANQFIGDILGELEDGNLLEGRYFNEVFEIRVWATNAKLRDDIYDDLKRILFIGKQLYLENDALDAEGNTICPFGDGGALIIRMLSGIDEADPNFFPGHPMFWGTIQLAIINQFKVAKTDEYGSIVSSENPEEGEFNLDINAGYYETDLN